MHLPSLRKNLPLSLRYEFWIPVIAIVAFYQVSFLQNSLKWDAIIGYGSSRYAVSQLLQENIFPLWRAFVSGGIPNYTSFSTSWSPLILIAGWLGNYTILTMHFFFVFYIAMAGWGMFHFINKIVENREIAFIAAISYMLSGVMVSHAQHMDIIAGTAWLPWVVLSYFGITRDLKFKYALQFTAIFYLLITDGYPAIAICAVYLIVFIGLYEFFRIAKTDTQQLKRFFLLNGFSILMLSILAAGLVVAYTNIAPEVTRFREVAASKSNVFPFTLQSFLSFLSPYSTAIEEPFFKSHISMNNAYFGIILLFTVAAGLFFRLPKIAWLFIISSFIWLWAGLGDDYYFKTFLYEFVPGMNKFRSPSIYRIPALLGFIVFGAFSLKHLVNNKLPKTKWLLLTFTVTLFAIWVITFFKTDFNTIDFSFKNEPKQLSARMFLQLTFQLMLIAGFSFLLFKKKLPTLKTLIWLVIIDLTMAAQLNMKHTVVSMVDPIDYYKQQINHPVGFPIPSTNNIIQNTDALFSFGPSWLNGSIFAKEVNHNGYNALILDKYRRLIADEPLLNATLSNPIAYLSSDLRPISSRNTETPITHKTLFASDSAWHKISNIAFSDSDADTIQVTQFRPGEIKLTVYSEKPQILTLLQTHFKGWKAYVDNGETEIFTTNHQFISIIIPEGTHQITFEYRNPIIRNLSLMSLFITIGLLLTLFFLNQHKYNRFTKLFLYIIIAIIALLATIKFFTPTHRQMQPKNYEKVKNLKKDWTSNIPTDSIAILLNIDNHSLAQQIDSTLKESEGINSQSRYYTTGSVSRLAFYFDTTSKPYLFYVWSNTKNIDELYATLYLYYPTLLKSEKVGQTAIALLKRSTVSLKKQHKTTILNYETAQNRPKPNNCDTVIHFEGKASYFMKPEQLYGGGTTINDLQNYNDSLNILIVKSYTFMRESTNTSLIVKFFAADPNTPIQVKSVGLSQDRKTFSRWKPVILSAKIPKNAITAQIFYYKPNQTETLWIDKTEIEIINESQLHKYQWER